MFSRAPGIANPIRPAPSGASIMVVAHLESGNDRAGCDGKTHPRGYRESKGLVDHPLEGSRHRVPNLWVHCMGHRTLPIKCPAICIRWWDLCANASISSRYVERVWLRVVFQCSKNWAGGPVQGRLEGKIPKCNHLVSQRQAQVRAPKRQERQVAPPFNRFMQDAT